MYIYHVYILYERRFDALSYGYPMGILWLSYGAGCRLDRDSMCLAPRYAVGLCSNKNPTYANICGTFWLFLIFMYYFRSLLWKVWLMLITYSLPRSYNLEDRPLWQHRYN